MFALTIDNLENLLTGLVIMNSAPNSSWMELLQKTATKYNLPDLTNDINYYRLKPVVWLTLAKQIKSVNAKTLIF